MVCAPVCAPVLSIIPSLKLRDFLSVQAHKPCSISHKLQQVLQCQCSCFKLKCSYSVLVAIYLQGMSSFHKLKSVSRKSDTSLTMSSLF